MSVIFEISEKTELGRHYAKILKSSPEFARIVHPETKGMNPATAEAIEQAKQGKGKRYKSVKSLIQDLKKI